MELYDSLERVDSSAKDSIPLALPKNWPKESIQELRVPRLVPPLADGALVARAQAQQGTITSVSAWLECVVVKIIIFSMAGM
jgi:hypothetical protein